jgi:hypothetical protein
VRWEVRVVGLRSDVSRLADEGLPGVTVDPTDPEQLVVELLDPEGFAVENQIAHAAKTVIDSVVRNINGVGRLRWGRSYGGVSIRSIRQFDADSTPTEVIYVDSAVEHLLPEEFADMVERMGHQRPKAPEGWDDIKALELGRLAEYAGEHSDVGRVLHLVDLMLVGDKEIDWAAAYSALEIIEQDLQTRGLKAQELGCWTAKERGRFRATANSPEVLGTRARHGKNSGLKAARMTSSDASWLVRRAAARWIIHLLDSVT